MLLGQKLSIAVPKIKKHHQLMWLKEHHVI